MATITYKVNGSFPPFSVELRSGSTEGTVIDTMVALSANTEYSFTGVPDSGEFFVVAYDNAFGRDSASTGFTTTTTTTTTSTTTTTTTLAPTTTTTTTLSPTDYTVSFGAIDISTPPPNGLIYKYPIEITPPLAVGDTINVLFSYDFENSGATGTGSITSLTTQIASGFTFGGAFAGVDNLVTNDGNLATDSGSFILSFDSSTTYFLRQDSLANVTTGAGWNLEVGLTMAGGIGTGGNVGTVTVDNGGVTTPLINSNAPTTTTTTVAPLGTPAPVSTGETFSTLNTFHTYDSFIIDFGAAFAGKTSTTVVDPFGNTPNRFTVRRNSDNGIVISTGWLGDATYSGPWGFADGGSPYSNPADPSYPLVLTERYYIFEVETSTGPTFTDNWNWNIPAGV